MKKVIIYVFIMYCRTQRKCKNDNMQKDTLFISVIKGNTFMTDQVVLLIELKTEKNENTCSSPLLRLKLYSWWGLYAVYMRNACCKPKKIETMLRYLFKLC